MYNERIKSKINHKYELKISFKTFTPRNKLIYSKYKNYDYRDKNIIIYEKYSYKKFCTKYNTLPENYAFIQINNLIFSKYYHLLSYFKDNLLFYYSKEFLNKYYSIKESKIKLPCFADFYKDYLLFFCLPRLKELRLNKLIEEGVEVKALEFYKKNYEDDDGDYKTKKEKNIYSIFFTNKIRKELSRKNTLIDLSKTTIEFNSISDKTNKSSYKSINLLINQISPKKNEINKITTLENNKPGNNNKIKNLEKDVNININNILNWKKINPKLNITPIEKNTKKKIQKIYINLDLINNKSNNNINKNINDIFSNKNIKYNKTENIISERQNTINNTSLMNHKINIVNNRIIIINNNGKNKRNVIKNVNSIETKIKLNKTKNTKSIVHRNYIKNNLASIHGKTFISTNSQDKNLKQKNFIDLASINKLSKERKTLFKSHKIINFQKKTNKKIKHLNNKTEKNLILKNLKSRNLQTENNINDNSKNVSSFFKGANIERNSSQKVNKKLLTNFQTFIKNIKNNSKNNKNNNTNSNIKYFSNNYKSSFSIINKNTKIKNVLKKSVLNTIENIRNYNIKNKSTSKSKSSKRNINKGSNLKIMSRITINSHNSLKKLITKFNKIK